jgi:hypothetical protein
MKKKSGWEDFAESAAGDTVRGAVFGGALGWLYDKMREKKDTKNRIILGAIIGSLGGLRHGLYRTIPDTPSSVSKINHVYNERQEAKKKEK